VIEDGLIYIIWGKITDYRKMAEGASNLNSKVIEFRVPKEYT